MSTSRRRCKILNHPDADAYLMLTLNVEDAEPHEKIEPCAFAVVEGLAYVVPIEEEGDVSLLVLLTEKSTFPPEAEDAPVARWWREATHKRTYSALKVFLAKHGIENGIRQLLAEVAPN